MPNVSNYTEQGGERTVIGGSLDVESGGELDIESGASLKLAGTAISATAAEINAVTDKSGSVVNVTGASVSLTAATHGERLVTVDKADGCAVTLPAAAGTGNKYTVIIGTTITSNSTTIKAANASDSFYGLAFGVDTDAEGASGYTWNADSGDDTVTLNGGATGGIAGDSFTFTDFAANKWHVHGEITQSGGSEATPFSATVS